MSKKIVEVEFEKDEHAQKHLHYTRFGFELLQSEYWTTRKESSDRIIREYMKNLYQFDKDRPHAKERLRLFRKYKWKCAERNAVQNAGVRPIEKIIPGTVGGVAGLLGTYLVTPLILEEEWEYMDIEMLVPALIVALLFAFIGFAFGILSAMMWAEITKKKRKVRALTGTKELDEQIEQITLEAQKLL